MIRSFALAATLLAAPVVAEPVSIETALGAATVATAPAAVAVYDMSALDMLDALKVGGLTSTNSTYLPYLKDYEGGLGTLHEPDFEALYVLNPDLVVAGGRSSKMVKDLAKIAPTIDMSVRDADVLPQIKARMTAFGALFDKADEAAALNDAFDAQIAATMAAISGKGTGLVVLTNGPKISAYGPGSRFGWIHSELDLPEAKEGIAPSNHGEAISFEFINEAQPDWLLVIDRVAATGANGETAQATLNNPLVQDTPAWKTGQVVYLNAQEIYIAGGGYQSVMHVLKDLETAFTDSNS